MSRLNRRRLTLVELMVAVTLGSILIGVITFVWLQSNEIFTSTINRLESYQRLRTILDVIERDLANTNRTTDMEFYVDKNSPPNGHYDDGTDEVKKALDGKHFRIPTSVHDPVTKLSSPQEFAIDGFHNDNPYLYAPTILSPEPYQITETGYTQGRAYWRDEIYVRTFASVAGVNRPALVHYRLVQPRDGGRSLLRRRIWFLNEKGEIERPDPATNDEGTDQVAILSGGICDLKFGFYFKPSTFGGTGRWYHVGQLTAYSSQEAKDLEAQDAQRGFIPTSGVPGNEADTALSRYHTAANSPFGGKNAMTFLYEGQARIEHAKDMPVALRTLTTTGALNTKKFTTPADSKDYDGFDFPGVRPGARVYVYGAVDDDSDFVSTAEAKGFFPDRLLTVDSIVAQVDKRAGSTASFSKNNSISLRFKEPINFFRLQSTWLGKEPEIEIGNAQVDANVAATPQRTVLGSFNVHYRVGFLPSAFMVRISGDDRNNQKVLPMERVIRLLQQ